MTGANDYYMPPRQDYLKEMLGGTLHDSEEFVEYREADETFGRGVGRA